MKPARTTGPPSESALKTRLDALAARYDRAFLHTDPIGIVRRYERPEDREIAGLLAASLAYGRVASIRASLERLFDRLGPSPAAFDPRRDGAALHGFVHRFHTGREIARLLGLVRRAKEAAGSLEDYFLAGDPDPAAPTLEGAMNAFVDRLFRLDGSPSIPPGAIPRGDGVRRLLAAPRDGSACKRHCLFLRWMVRPDDGVDCGVWTRVRASRLVIPLDVHLHRVAAALGWTRRKSPSWGTALEVTAHLRRLAPDDPVRYDFALSRLGILGRLRTPSGRLTRGALSRVLAAPGGAE